MKTWLLVFFILITATSASANVISFYGTYTDYEGVQHNYTQNNLDAHPYYTVTENELNYTISRQGTNVTIPKRTWINYTFLPERIQPTITIQNFSQIDQLVTKVNTSTWYITVPWTSTQVKTISNTLIDMGVFRRSLYFTVRDSNYTCGMNCPTYSILPKVVGGDIRIYFNPQTYLNVTYPLIITENTIVVNQSNSSQWFNTTSDLVIDYLIVAGGGGGGSTSGGGGGGGVLYGESYSLPAGNYYITVGTGGAGNTGGNKGANGTNSSLGSLLIAIGGGGGAGYGANQFASDGGSGGGGATGDTSGASGTSGQGNSGGNGQICGGGGGGKNTTGKNNQTCASSGDGGAGGDAFYININGTAGFYGGGGGGGGYDGTGGTGGNSTGGRGGDAGSSDLATAGVAGTGGGGGGGGAGGGYGAGKAGGSGVVVIRYESTTTYIPPTPINCQATTGNFYVNMSCEAGVGNVTDGINKSMNGVGYNDTAFFKNITLSAHAWGNGSYQAWNNSGVLNTTPATLNTQIPNNAISISGVSTSYSLNEGQTLTIDANYADADSDVGVFSTNLSIGSIDSGTGIYTLNSVVGNQGVYNGNISVTDNNGSTSIANFTLTVNYALVPATEPSGVYAFRNGSIPSNATILNYKNNNILTTVITLDWDNISSANWTSLLGGINYSYTNGIRTSLRLNLGGDYTNTGIQNNTKNNITTYFPDLTSDPYQSDVQWIELNFTNSTSASADKKAYANLTAKNISEKSANKFPVYTVESLSGLDADYVKSSPLIYLNVTNNSDFISQESITTRGNTTLSRVYSGNESVLPSISYYKIGGLNRLRGTIHTSHPTESYATYVNNGSSGFDLILYNNLSTTQNRTIANQIGTFLDTNNDIMRKLTSSGTLHFNVSAENFTYVLNESVSKIILNDTTHQVYGASNTYNGTFTHGTNYTNQVHIFAGTNTDIKSELFDPSNIKTTLTMIHYEWINASVLSNYSGYKYVIVADKNAGEINGTINRSDAIYIYYAVNDYVDNGNTWIQAKKDEIAWALSRGYGIFLDGIDFEITAANFSTGFKSIVDDIRINNSKQVICNTYTAYQTFATYCNAIMKESAFSRWDGTVGSPVYSWEDMMLEKQRADYYTSHNLPVIAMAFGDVTDYSKQTFGYYATAVLYGFNGNNSYRYGQPNFQSQKEYTVPDFGTMLETGYTETSSTDWNRLYSKGRVHINPVAHTYWIDDAKVVNEMSLELYLYKASEGTGDLNLSVTINQPNGTMYNISSSEFNSASVGSWQYKKISIPTSEYKDYGIYPIYAATRPNTGGWQIGLDTTGNNKSGLHSWYDTTGTNINNTGNDSAFSWGGWAKDQNYIMKLTINYTTQFQADTLATSTISQSDSRSAFNRTVIINSTNEYNTSIFSKPIKLITTAITNIWFKAIDGTWSSANIPASNVSDINSTNPSWTETIIDGYVYGVIIQYISPNSWWVKFLFPHLSQQEAMVSENVAPSIPVLTEHDDFHTLESTTVNWTVSTDDNGDTVTYDVKVYNTTTGVLVVNQTNISANYSQGFLPANRTNYNFSTRAYDGLNYSDWASALVFNFTNALPSISNTTNQTVDENGTVFVDMDGSDTDGDGLVFSANRTDLFTDFSLSTGKGNWTTNFTSSGTYYVDFGVSDGYNNTNYTTIITITNTPLSITAFQPSSDPSVSLNTAQVFNITLNRSANVTWKLDGASVQTNTSATIANYTNSGATAGTFNITVNATDGIDSVSRTWNLTVTAPPTSTAGTSGSSSISPVDITEPKEIWTDGRKDYPFAVAFEGKDGRIEPLNSNIHSITALNILFKTPTTGTHTITISTYIDFKPRLNGSIKYFSITPSFSIKQGSSIELVLKGINKDVELYQFYNDGKWKKVSKGTKLSTSKDTYRFPVISFGMFAVKQVGQEVTANMAQAKRGMFGLDFSQTFKDLQKKDKEAYETLKVKLVWLVELIDGLKALISTKLNNLL